MNLSGQAQAELIKVAAVVLIAAVLIYGGNVVVDKLLTALRRAGQGVDDAVDSVVDVIKSPFTPAAQPWTADSANPDWTHVQSQGFDWLTRSPGQFSQTRLDLYAVDP